MDLTCANCQKEIFLPPEKIPNVPRFALKCPGCGERIVVENEAYAKENKTAVDKEQVRQTKSIEPDFFPPGANVAFLFTINEEIGLKVSEFFQEKEFYISTAEDVQEGVLKLRLNDYQLILLEDREEIAPLLTEIHSWPGKKRRNVNCLLIGDRAPSMHQQEAFYRGVNFYLHINDKDRIDDLLEQCLNGFVLYNEPWTMALMVEE
ncbi:hypothetical protein KFV02_08710 [Desulfohalobiaceae bacterium Ax17]|jgi:DNA-directed RNA polymerase subunit RPC12/RpoP|uniref:zinc-ribbon domain-containing protein n=1 Tax=Desulfovulcanus ferrireducens TaxID=2831190 RepID=UPI00207BBF53|nr:zinc-ribbon domain-containing protein [Desulfovulcanus ferrireducens]MBT8764009.1 hypothetical protein [Desulfovulcanus ferrireducens]